MIDYSKELGIEKDQTRWLRGQVKVLREALEGWMIDHGDRCRICMERSQQAIKAAQPARKPLSESRNRAKNHV